VAINPGAIKRNSRCRIAGIIRPSGSRGLPLTNLSVAGAHPPAHEIPQSGSLQGRGGEHVPGSGSVIDRRNSRCRDDSRRFDAAHVQIVLNPGRITQSLRGRGTHNERTGMTGKTGKPGFNRFPVSKRLTHGVAMWNMNLDDGQGGDIIWSNRTYTGLSIKPGCGKDCQSDQTTQSNPDEFAATTPNAKPSQAKPSQAKPSQDWTPVSSKSSPNPKKTVVILTHLNRPGFC